MTEHSKLFSPSKFDLTMTCPPSAILSLQIKEKTNPAAERGIVMHEVAAKLLKNEFNPNSTKQQKTRKEKELFKFLKDDEERSIVQEYLTEVYTLKEKFLSQLDGEFVELIEMRVKHPEFEDYFGTCDYGIIGEKNGTAQILLIDLKSGLISIDWEETVEEAEGE